MCAKAQFLNMKQFNGFFGCQFCKEKVKRVENVLVYPYSDDPELRTTEESVEFAKAALKSSNDIFGVKRPTALSLFAYKYIETTAIIS